MNKPAIFLDRDGTLSHEVGYVNHPSRFRLYPWSVDAVRAINRAGWLAVLVTNQAGVARGYFPEKVVHQVMDKLKSKELIIVAGDTLPPQIDALKAEIENLRGGGGTVAQAEAPDAPRAIEAHA